MATTSRGRSSLLQRRTTSRPKPTYAELRRELDNAFAARDGKSLMRLYRSLSAMQREGRVGRRRACAVCLAMTRPELSGEVIHAAGCALQGALGEVEAFITTGGRTRNIHEARAVKNARPAR